MSSAAPSKEDQTAGNIKGQAGDGKLPGIEPEPTRTTLNQVTIISDESFDVKDPEKTKYDDPDEQNQTSPDIDKVSGSHKVKAVKGKGAFRSSARNGMYIAHMYEPLMEVYEAEPYSTQYRYEGQPYDGGKRPYDITYFNAYSYLHSLDRHRKRGPIRKYSEEPEEKKTKEDHEEKKKSPTPEPEKPDTPPVQKEPTPKPAPVAAVAVVGAVQASKTPTPAPPSTAKKSTPPPVNDNDNTAVVGAAVIGGAAVGAAAASNKKNKKKKKNKQRVSPEPPAEETKAVAPAAAAVGVGVLGGAAALKTYDTRPRELTPVQPLPADPVKKPQVPAEPVVVVADPEQQKQPDAFEYNAKASIARSMMKYRFK